MERTALFVRARASNAGRENDRNRGRVRASGLVDRTRRIGGTLAFGGVLIPTQHLCTSLIPKILLALCYNIGLLSFFLLCVPYHGISNILLYHGNSKVLLALYSVA